METARESLAVARGTIEGCPDPGILLDLLDRAGRGITRPPRRGSSGPAGLSDELSERELSVLRLLPSDLSQKEIADSLFVSRNTVKTHVRAIFRKLGVSRRAEAVERALEQSLF